MVMSKSHELLNKTPNFSTRKLGNAIRTSGVSEWGVTKEEKKIRIDNWHSSTMATNTVDYYNRIAYRQTQVDSNFNQMNPKRPVKSKLMVDVYQSTTKVLISFGNVTWHCQKSWPSKIWLHRAERRWILKIKEEIKEGYACRGRRNLDKKKNQIKWFIPKAYWISYNEWVTTFTLDCPRCMKSNHIMMQRQKKRKWKLQKFGTDSCNHTHTKNFTLKSLCLMNFSSFVRSSIIILFYHKNVKVTVVKNK